MGDKIVEAHIQTETNTEYAFYPKHIERSESGIFRRAKRKLENDGHCNCFICNTKENLEAHHIFEWAFAEAFSFDKIKEVLMTMDFYGYSKFYKDIPITTIDDVRNMLMLCPNHHRGETCGIHEISFPLWLSQRVTKDGILTVPQSKEDLSKFKK